MVAQVEVSGFTQDRVSIKELLLEQFKAIHERDMPRNFVVLLAPERYDHFAELGMDMTDVYRCSSVWTQCVKPKRDRVRSTARVGVGPRNRWGALN